MEGINLAASFRLRTRLGLTLLAFATIISSKFYQMSSILRDLMPVHEGDVLSAILEATAGASKQLQAYDTLSSSKCAINLYGLPRSFKRLVLPSFVEHVVKPNLKHNCDYFVHYHALTHEAGGRSGYGGSIVPTEILALEDALRKVVEASRVNSTSPQSIRMPIVAFSSDTEEEFQARYRNFTDVIETAKAANGDLLYLPTKTRSYTKDTIVNIFKMWHSQQAVWNLMEEHNRQYEQVGMFRSDVFYVTDIDIYSTGEKEDDQQQKDGREGPVGQDAPHNRSSVAIVPAFAKGPVNDRFISGPYEAVKIWAAERFQRLEHHVHVTIPRKARGFALHSERFLSLTIFPAIRSEAGIPVVEDRRLCFLRARVDGTIWVNDCGDRGKPSRWKLEAERILQRECSRIHPLVASENATVKGGVKIIEC